jgi:hypothetical protein
MSHATSTLTRETALRRTGTLPVDFAVAVGFILLFAVWAYVFRYHDALAESDLYRVLVGLMDGANAGTGIASNLQYDHDFGFGYLAAFYAFASPATLHDPDRLMALMNEVGFWFMLAGLLCFWTAVTVLNGARAGTLALIVFALGPMIPELATSGHQVIPMFAFLCAGATLLFLPLRGGAALLAQIGGFALLLAGLVTRGEIFLAFPWIVLSRVDTESVPRFIWSFIVRSIAPGGALLVFFILQHMVIDTRMGAYVGNYYGQFYSWSHVVPGLAYMALGCGIATTLVGGLAALWLGWRTARGRGVPRPIGAAQYLGPLALVLFELVFFDPNPMPTRHFLLTLAGFSILIGIALTRGLALRRWVALAIVVLLGAANQVAAEAVRLPLLHADEARSPYRTIWPGYQTATHANLGWEWTRHEALVRRRALWQALGNELPTACQAHTMIFTDEGEQLFSRLYAGGVPVQAKPVQIDGFFGIEGVRRGKTFIALQKMNGWPKDAVATILADPAYADYKLVNDPYTMSVYDKTAIPADRAAKFGCADAPG